MSSAYILMRRELGLPPSRLRVAGYRGADQQVYFDGIARALDGAGLGAEFEYAGAPTVTSNTSAGRVSGDSAPAARTP